MKLDNDVESGIIMWYNVLQIGLDFRRVENEK
jgi:hypothetical protein